MAASILAPLLSGGLGEAGKGIASIINSIKGKSPEDAAHLADLNAQIEELRAKYKSEFDMATLEYNKAVIAADTQQNQIASDNIRAEIQSPDAYVRRARSTPVWVTAMCMAIYGAILPFIVVIGRWRGHDIPVPVLPMPFWYLCYFIIGGYIASRVADRTTGGGGGSISFMGLKLDSKGD